MPSAVDIVIIVLTVALPVLYFFRESLPFIGGRTRAAAPHALVANKTSVEEGDPSDFVGKMRRAVRVSGTEIGRLEVKLTTRCRTSAVSSSMVLKLVLPKNTLSVLPRKPNLATVFRPLSAILKNTT